jgi:hypothetical protein
MRSGMYDMVWTVFHWPPSVGLCIGILGFLAVVVSFRLEVMKPPEKTFWIFVTFVLLLAEVYAIQSKEASDRADAIEAQVQSNDRFAEVLRQSQDDFDATMGRIESVITKEDRTLLQTMGGDAFPLFIPVLPAVSSPNGPVMPVKVINSINTRGRPNKLLPLVDVNVDISIQLHNGNYQEAGMSALHSDHYNLGNILPGVFETPIKLQPGKIYNLAITTRRRYFVETIDIVNEKAGNWCMSERVIHGNRVEEHLVDRGDGKPLTEPCN